MEEKRILNILKNVYWGFFGRSIRNPPLPPAPRSLLFLCKGNICRSPFAAEMAGRLCREEEGFRYRSAGIDVLRQMPSPEEAVDAARQFGVNLEKHISRGIDIDMLESHDMILVMDAGQFRYMRRHFPRFRDKIFLLSLFEIGHGSGADRDRIFNIEDPYDKSLDAFRGCYSRITRCLEGLFGQIHK